MSKTQRSVLVFGSTGFVGAQFMSLINNSDDDDVVVAVAAESRLEYLHDIEAELDRVRPWRVINCGGMTGRPTVDGLETRKADANRVNVAGMLLLAGACLKRDVKLCYIGTGCIFSYDAEHALGSGIGFTEEDKPNFFGSWYSLQKGMLETLLSAYSNVLTLRLRMPINDELGPRNFVTKIVKYDRVVDIANSMSVLHDLLPVALDMTYAGITGVVNFTNPGTISHNEVLALYKQYLDPEFVWENFTEAEQSRILAAGRSNNELDTAKLCTLNPTRTIPHIKDAVEQCFRRMRDAGVAPLDTDAKKARLAEIN
jgi:3,5-epimerase/4-reductase